MEFNEITLAPTYRLIHGLSGASSGLKIAERLQLPNSVLRAATGFLDATEADAAHYVEELRQRIVDLETEKARVEKERKDFEEESTRNSRHWVHSTGTRSRRQRKNWKGLFRTFRNGHRESLRLLKMTPSKGFKRSSQM